MNEFYKSCVLCDQNYSEKHLPRVLQCGHCFCHICLHKSIRQELNCPECDGPIVELNLNTIKTDRYTSVLPFAFDDHLELDTLKVAFKLPDSVET